MRIWRIGNNASLHLTLEERADPVPADDHVVVSVRAVALNHRDLLVANGRVKGVPEGRVPCSDAAGTVAAVGRLVTGVRPGDTVMTTFAPQWVGGPLSSQAAATALGGVNADGVLAERIVLPAQAVVPIPASWTFEQAATLPCAGLTAWHALFEERPPGRGNIVLTIGSGGVSCFAIQFARRAGYDVIAVSRNSHKLDRLTALGATATVDSAATPSWGDAVHAISEGGVHHVLEVGGQGTLSQSIRATRHGGTISLIGTLARPVPVDLTPVLMRNICVQGIVAGSREMMRRMVDSLDDGSLTPVIDRVFSFADAPAAFEYLESGAQVGKVIIRVT